MNKATQVSPRFGSESMYHPGSINLYDLDRMPSPLGGMPTPSASVKQLFQDAVCPESDMDALRETILGDRVLSNQIQEIANASFAFRGIPITSLKAALRLLGRSFVLTAAVSRVAQAWTRSPMMAYLLDTGKLWEHSVRTALAVKVAHRYCERPFPTHSMATALLHDMGKVVLESLLSQEVIWNIWKDERYHNLPRHVAESAHVGLDHADAGAWLLEQWELPQSMSQGILYHHFPTMEEPTLVHVIHLANGLATALETFERPSLMQVQVHRHTYKHLGLDAEDVPTILGEMKQQYQELYAVLTEPDHLPAC